MRREGFALQREAGVRSRLESHTIGRSFRLRTLIAEFQGTSTKVIASCSSLDEAKLFATTLETGVDGVAITISDPSKLGQFSTLTRSDVANVELAEATVRAVRPVSVGDRVCVDTCSMLAIGEGMLVGSQSACLFLVQSESMDSHYVSSVRSGSTPERCMLTSSVRTAEPSTSRR